MSKFSKPISSCNHRALLGIMPFYALLNWWQLGEVGRERGLQVKPHTPDLYDVSEDNPLMPPTPPSYQII